MLREAAQKHFGYEDGFRYRGVEPGRLENFSDACFALAITLLLISTSPPTSFLQIKKFLFDLVPFIMCITLIVLIWFQHFIFFYRYGMRSGATVALNALFLIIVLFYVYPLKFLTKLSLIPVAMLFDIEWLYADLRQMIEPSDMSALMIVYGLGAMAASFTLMLMYRHAWNKRAELDLNELEQFDTKVSMRTNFLMGIVPVMAVVMAILFYDSYLSGMLSGFTYMLYTPIMFWHGRKVDKERDALLRKLQEGTHKETTAQV